MTRPILVFGAGGRVGGELMTCAYLTMAPRPVPWAFQGAIGFDVTKPEQVAAKVAELNPIAIVNLAACTLPHAEKPEARGEANAVNTDAVTHMADLGLPIIHISTDCVFNGEKATPYTEADTPHPINYYGWSKWNGEIMLTLGARERHIILRTTGVYLRGKPNFLETVLAKAKAGETLEVVSDTLYTPTDARELAKAILLATERVIEDPSVSGTYHFAGPDVMSYLEFARLVLEESGTHAEIKPVTAAEREAVEGFKRPKNAALNSDKFAETFGLRHRPTRECVRELLNPA